MKRRTRAAAALATISTMTLASAASLDFLSVFKQVGSARLSEWFPNGSTYAVTLPVQGGAGLSMKVATSSAFVSASMTGTNLTAGERLAAGKFAAHVALKCFNLRSERREAIINWVRTQLGRGAETGTMFGPLVLSIEKNGANTSVVLQREGMPGQSPWVNYCVNGRN